MPLLVDGGVWLKWFLNDVGIEISLAGGMEYCLLHELFFDVTVRSGIEGGLRRLYRGKIMADWGRKLLGEAHSRMLVALEDGHAAADDLMTKKQ